MFKDTEYYVNMDKPDAYRRRALFITMIAMIVVYVLWNIPSLGFILYPLKLFTTYIHESGHAQ